MKNLRERWRGLTVLGVVAFAAACMTVAPVPSFADIAGGGGDGGPITEWCHLVQLDVRKSFTAML